ncbi:MAG: PAS domain S-box protein [candidate division Zixibacteria bacterium]|nr:PAS domain S-box protein [candidate division Zixibacteria bacterium]
MGKLRILYIEDNMRQRKALTGKLRSRGLTLTVATSGRTGLGFLKKRTFDAILCDLNMPRMNGLEMLERVRAKDQNIPFIILTAHGTVSLAVKALKKGANHFILKPPAPDEIVISIKQLIENAKLQQKLKDSQAALNIVMENVPDVVYSLNNKGDFVSLSPAVEAILGYKPAELIGQSVFNVIFEGDRGEVSRSFKKSMKLREVNTRTLEFRMVTKKGDVKHFEVSRKLVVENGKIVRIDGIARDISDRLALQNKLKEYSHQLEDKVRERTQSLEYANLQLSALNIVSTKFSRIYDQEKLYDEIPKMLTTSLDFDRAYLVIEDEGRLNVRSWCCRSKSTARLEAYIKKINKGSVKIPSHFTLSLKQKKTIFVCDLKKDKLWPKKPSFLSKAKSMVISPIKVKGKVFGLIAGFIDRPEYEMNKQDVQRCVTFANIVGMAIDNIRAYQSLENKVAERTQSLKSANDELKLKAKTIEKSQIELAKANIELLGVQEQLQNKNTEMEELLKQLSESKNVLQAIIDASPNAILMVNNSDKIVATNSQITDLFGLEVNEVIDKNINRIHTKIKKRFNESDRFVKLYRQLQAHPDLDFEKSMDPHVIRKRTFKTSDKTSRYISVFCISIPSINSEEMVRLWTFIDITKMVQADEQLHMIVEASPTPLIITRVSDGQIMFANEHLGELVGSTPEELVGRKSPDFYYHREDRELVLEGLKRDGYLKNHEVRLKRMDGSVFWAIFSLVIAEVDGEPVIIGGIHDIDQRRKMEDELRWERNFVSTVLDTAGALVLVLDNEGRIVRFNKASQDITGYSFDEVKGKYFWDILLLPEELDEVKAVFHSLKAGYFPNSHENYFLNKDGSKKLIAWSNTALTDENGEVEYIIATGLDLTERKEAEEKLKLYKEIYMNTSDGITLIGPDGTMFERNPAHRKYSGFSDEELYGKTPAALLGEDTMREINQAIARKGTFRGELEIENKQGVKIGVDLSLFPIMSDSGELICYCGMGRDITERKRAAEAIAVRLRYEEALAACSQSLLTGVDSENALTEALGHLLNAANTGRVYIFENFEDKTDGLCMRLTHGVCEKGVVPQIDNPDLLHVPYKMGYDDWIEILSNGEIINTAVESFPQEQRDILEPQGILSMLVIPIFVSGQWFGFIGFDDVKERRVWGDEDIRTLQTASEMIGLYIEHNKFEEALRVSEERFRTLVENANDIIYSVSEEGNFTYISPTVTDILGHFPNEVIGKPMFYMMHPDEEKLTREGWERGMMKTRPKWSGYRFRLKHKDGSYRWFISNSSVILDENGEIIEIVGIAHDITEIQNLLNALELKNDELKAAQSQLVQSEKMASLGMLVAGIAHEINTPIAAATSMHNTSVRAMTKLQEHLSDKFKSEIQDDEIICKTLKVIGDANKVIESGAGRVTEIVKRLRSFARLDEAELKEVDIHEGLEDTLTLIHHEIKHGITVVRNFGDLPRITCFPGQLNQVFLNLLVNASQAIQGKGTITLTTCSVNDKIRVEIEDTGSGIAMENLEKVFDPGFTTKGVGVGTGLGLSICYQIISSHHGEIKAESQIGKGTKFIIVLPTNLDVILERESFENQK